MSTVPSSRVTSNPDGEWLTDATDTPSSSAIPSEPRTSARTADASGSSGPTRTGAASMMVTVAPNRWNTWASSTPMAPPPSTSSDSGTDSVAIASRLVQ